MRSATRAIVIGSGRMKARRWKHRPMREVRMYENAWGIMSRPSSGAVSQFVDRILRRRCESDKRRRKEAQSAKTRKVVVKLWKRV